MAINLALRMPKVLFTTRVVMTKPNQMKAAEITPFLIVTSPRWPIMPASIQAMIRSATSAMMSGQGAMPVP